MGQVAGRGGGEARNRGQENDPTEDEGWPDPALRPVTTHQKGTALEGVPGGESPRGRGEATILVGLSNGAKNFQDRSEFNARRILLIIT